MAINFGRHDITAKSLSAPDRQTYAATKARLIKERVSQAQVDDALSKFFWQCFEDDDEDEDEDEIAGDP